MQCNGRVFHLCTVCGVQLLLGELDRLVSYRLIDVFAIFLVTCQIGGTVFYNISKRRKGVFLTIFVFQSLVSRNLI